MSYKELSLGSQTETLIKAPIGFEPMNQGFADPYNRPLCQGAIVMGKWIILNRLTKSRNFSYTPLPKGTSTKWPKIFNILQKLDHTPFHNENKFYNYSSFELSEFSPPSELSKSESELSGKSSSSIQSQSLALVSASTNSLLLPYFLAEYSLRIGTIFLFW